MVEDFEKYCRKSGISDKLYDLNVFALHIKYEKHKMYLSALFKIIPISHTCSYHIIDEIPCAKSS